MTTCFPFFIPSLPKQAPTEQQELESAAVDVDKDIGDDVDDVWDDEDVEDDEEDDEDAMNEHDTSEQASNVAMTTTTTTTTESIEEVVRGKLYLHICIHMFVHEDVHILYYNLTFLFSRFCRIKYERTNLHTNTVALVVVFERRVHECEGKNCG